MPADFVPPVLYSFRRCPYAMRARLAIVYSEVMVELREVVLRNKPASMLAYSPKATVPVLVLSEQQVIDESLDIMHWALSLNDPAGLLANLSEQQQAEASELIKENDGFFKHHLDRYKYPNRYDESEDVDSVELKRLEIEHRNQAEVFLIKLNDRLSANRYLMGDDVCIADIAIFPFVRQFAFVDKNWFDQSPYPKLQNWLAQWLESTRFTQVMHKYSAWDEGDEPTIFTGIIPSKTKTP